MYRVIKKSLCTWRLYCNHLVHWDFFITLYYVYLFNLLICSEIFYSFLIRFTFPQTTLLTPCQYRKIFLEIDKYVMCLSQICNVLIPNIPINCKALIWFNERYLINIWRNTTASRGTITNSLAVLNCKGVRGKIPYITKHMLYYILRIGANDKGKFFGIQYP
jgi:hypothetical protein